MPKVFKYRFEISDHFELALPGGAKPVLVGLDPQGAACIWFIVNPGNPEFTRHFFCLGTGHPIPINAQTHIGSFIMPPFVWHIFTDGSEETLRL